MDTYEAYKEFRKALAEQGYEIWHNEEQNHYKYLMEEVQELREYNKRWRLRDSESKLIEQASGNMIGWFTNAYEFLSPPHTFDRLLHFFTTHRTTVTYCVFLRIKMDQE